MSGAFIPVWIIGGPFLGLLLLSLLYRGGTSAAVGMDRSFHRDVPAHRDLSGHHDLSADTAQTVNDREAYAPHDETPRSAELDAIARLSGPVAPGAIAELSRHVNPGAIAKLSGHKSPGAISQWSRRVSPGAIARLSGHTAPGAIASLSAPKPVGAIARLSNGWFASQLFGLPLLTASQGPIEPDGTLLTSDREPQVSGRRDAPRQTGESRASDRVSRLG